MALTHTGARVVAIISSPSWTLVTLPDSAAQLPPYSSARLVGVQPQKLQDCWHKHHVRVHTSMGKWEFITARPSPVCSRGEVISPSSSPSTSPSTCWKPMRGRQAFVSICGIVAIRRDGCEQLCASEQAKYLSDIRLFRFARGVAMGRISSRTRWPSAW